MFSNKLQYIVLIMLTACLYCCTSFTAKAQSSQNDTGIVSDSAAEDTLKHSAPLRKKDKRPRNATIMSALVPGLGQVYNKQYWKLPFLYGLGGVLGYFIVSNNNSYQEYKVVYEDVVNASNPNILSAPHNKGPVYNGDSVYTYNSGQLQQARDYYRRNRDLTVILTAGLYVLNLLDAHVSGHLRSFDISDKLTLKFNPKITPTLYSRPVFGLSMNLVFK